MINKATVALLTILTFAFNSSIAQKAQSSKKVKGIANFVKTSHDFGLIEEKQGRVRIRFEFTNTGSGDVSIKGVETTCGCTIPEWFKGNVKPGNKGYIDVEFDPSNKVGPFTKTLTVTTDGDPRYQYLTINGEVYQHTPELLNSFPFSQGNLRLTANIIKYKPMLENTSDSITFTIMNNSKRDMSIIKIVTPPFIKARITHPLLTPGNVTDITYIIDAAASAELGPVSWETFLYTSDDSLPKKYMPVKAEIIQNFNTMGEDFRKSPPKLKWTNTTVDLGEVYEGEIITYEIPFKNEGKSELLIRKAAASCGCTVSSFNKAPIKKGKSASVKIAFNAAGLRGPIEKTLTVYANDPENPVTIIKIKAKVVIPGVDPIKSR